MNVAPISPLIPASAETILFSELARVERNHSVDYFREQAIKKGLRIFDGPFTHYGGLLVRDIDQLVDVTTARAIRHQHGPRKFDVAHAQGQLGLPFSFEVVNLAARRGVLVERNPGHEMISQDGCWILAKLLMKEREISTPMDPDDFVSGREALDGLRKAQSGTMINFFMPSEPLFESPPFDQELTQRCSWLQIRWEAGKMLRGKWTGNFWKKPGIGLCGFDLWRLAGVTCADSDVQAYTAMMNTVRAEVFAELKLPDALAAAV